MSFFRDTVLGAGSTLALAVGRFVTMAIIARALEVETFGVLAYAVMCVDLIVMTALFGLSGIAARFVPAAKRGEMRSFALLRLRWLFGSLVVIAVIAPATGFLVVDLDDRLLVLFTIWALIGAVQTVLIGEFQGAFRFDLLTWSSVLCAGALVAGAMVLVSPDDLEAAFIVLMLGPLIQILPAAALIFGTAPDRDTESSSGLPSRRQIFAFGGNQWINSITSVLVWSRGELIVVEGRLSDEDVGLYGASVTLVAVVWRMLGLMQSAAGPHLSARLDDPKHAAAMILPVTRLSFGLCTAVAIILTALGSEIAVLCFGARYAGAGDILLVMAPGAIVAGNGIVLLTVHYMSNGAVTRNLLILASITLLVLALGLVEIAGAQGAALARSLVLISLAAALPVWLIWQGMDTLGRALLREILSSVAIMAVVSASIYLLEPGLALRAGLGALCAYAVLARAARAVLPWRILGNAVFVMRQV